MPLHEVSCSRRYRSTRVRSFDRGPDHMAGAPDHANQGVHGRWQLPSPFTHHHDSPFAKLATQGTYRQVLAERTGGVPCQDPYSHAGLDAGDREGTRIRFDHDAGLEMLAMKRLFECSADVRSGPTDHQIVFGQAAQGDTLLAASG